MQKNINLIECNFSPVERRKGIFYEIFPSRKNTQTETFNK